MKITFSIIMPVYNSEKYIRFSIDSILKQTYRNFELICIDDGSKDESLNIIKEIAKSDRRLIVMSQNNQYAGVARNNGIRVAKGEYILFLDSDDIFEKNMLKLLAKKINKTCPDIIEFGYWSFSNNIKKRRPARNHFKRMLVCPTEISESIFQMTRSLTWDKAISRKLINKTEILFGQSKVNNDIYFNRTIVTSAEKILFLPTRLVNYRISNSSSLQGVLNTYPTDFIRENDRIYNYLNKDKKLEIYIESFYKVFCNDVVEHLKRINSYDEFEKIYRKLNESETFQNIGLDCCNFKKYNADYARTLEKIYNQEYPSECISSFFSDYRSQSVAKASIEYSIGHVVLKMLSMSE